MSCVLEENKLQLERTNQTNVVKENYDITT